MPRFVLLWLLAICAAQAQTSRLTILGDPANASIDTIQVDPIPVAVSGDLRTLRIRVNRPIERTSRDDIRYRSYESVVLFDCASRTARYLEIRFYLQPLWLGEVNTSVTYPDSTPRWMLFREVEPNPYQRIINAACGAIGRR